MTHSSLGSTSMEMGGSTEFAGRIKRLILVSAFALGSIWFVAMAKLGLPLWIDALLVGGWLLMPTLLAISLRLPRVRYLIAIPAVMVSLGLAAILWQGLPTTTMATVGWSLVLLGVSIGGALGLWLWYRLLPVPDALNYPFSTGRWVLVGIHLMLIIVGLALATAG